MAIMIPEAIRDRASENERFFATMLALELPAGDPPVSRTRSQICPRRQIPLVEAEILPWNGMRSARDTAVL